MNNVYIEELFNKQRKDVIHYLLYTRGCSYNEAENLWVTSRTKYILQDFHKLYWLPGFKCYIELSYELDKSPLWLKTAFN